MRLVVVGAGQAGAWLARTVREADPAAQITLLGAELHPPYERPPLSKSVLAGEAAEPDWVLTAQDAAEQRIDLRLGVRVSRIDRDRRMVELQDGEVLTFDRLVLATGGRARRLTINGGELPQVRTLRSWDDCRAIAAQLRPGAGLVVLGAGWIGLEVAATARRAGLHVTVLEPAQRVCARSIPPDFSDYVAGLHRAQGVELLLQRQAQAIRPLAGGGVAVVLGDGEALRADLVIAGIGQEPDVDLAREAGLAIDNGVVVDAFGQTSDPAIYAVGDVANQPVGWPGCEAGRRIRLESWANAQNHAIAVGRAMAGVAQPYAEIPWFWSDQYDMNLQVLGVPGTQGERTLRGTPQSGKFCVFETAGGRLQSVVAVNMAREVKLARRWMLAGTCPSPAVLADPAVRLDKL